MAKADEEKYSKVRMSSREMNKIAKSMDEYIKENKLYLKADIKMSDIASGLGMSPSVLSQVFALHMKQSYYDYINTMRIAEFKRKIAKGEHNKLTIKAISEECGFKKTSFFSAFRKLEGLTPTEYIKGVKVKK